VLNFLAYAFLATLVMVQPIIWFQHCLVRKARWYSKAIGLDWSHLRFGRHWLEAGGYACILMVALLAASRWLIFLGIEPSIKDPISRSLDYCGPWWGFVLSLVWGCLIAPPVEETIYRGFLFSSMLAAWGWKWGAVLSGVVFGLMHVYSASGCLTTIAMGIGLAWVYHRTGKLAMAMMTHALVNLIITVWWQVS
jgi:membrane protease YdiL (CAAX protease family)